jgi:hypothetical protein
MRNYFIAVFINHSFFNHKVNSVIFNLRPITRKSVLNRINMTPLTLLTTVDYMTYFVKS